MRPLWKNKYIIALWVTGGFLFPIALLYEQNSVWDWLAAGVAAFGINMLFWSYVHTHSILWGEEYE